MNLAIIESKKIDLENLKNMLIKFYCENSINLKISEFKSGEKFLLDFKRDKYDLIFINIYTDGMLGIDTAESIRRTDNQVMIIFTGDSGEFAINSYDVRAFYYILKPVLYNKISDILNLSFDILNKLEKKIYIISQRANITINFSDILYIETIRNYLEIHTVSQVFKTYKTFVSLSQVLLRDKRFVNCIRGVLVNLNYVDRIDGNKFLLKNGQYVPIRNKDVYTMKKIYAEFLVR